MPFKTKCYICNCVFNLKKGHKYLLFLLCLLSLRFQQPSTYDTNAKIKAVFIYNFTKYFEWPDKKKTGNFVIYVAGKSDNLITELKTLATKRKVGNQDIEVKNSSSYDPGIQASIIYLLPEENKSVGAALAKNKGNGTLLVAEGLNSCKAGASINFTVIDSKLKFEYSKSNAVKAGLKTNDDFKALAVKNID